MKAIRRLIHDQVNILTSINGFLELALGEPDRSTRYRHMMRAQKEIRRMVALTKDLQQQVDAKARSYGDTF